MANNEKNFILKAPNTGLKPPNNGKPKKTENGATRLPTPEGPQNVQGGDKNDNRKK